MPFEVPEGWVWCKPEEICHIAGRIGFRGYTKEDLVNKGNGAITLSPSNIIDGEMNYSKCTYISWKKYEESPEIQICNGDILLVKTGSSFGKCAFVRNLPQEATINPQFVVIKYIGCNKEYLTFVLQSQYARNNYDSFVLGTAIPTFTQAALGDMLIPLPPIHEQNNIVKEVKYREVLINIINCNQEDLASSIEQTKSKILDLAIHGKLVPQDPNDEPAIELLKRINPDFTPCDNGHYPQLPFEAPQNWSWTTLGKIGKWQSGSTPNRLNKDYYNGNIPWLKTGDLNNGYITHIPESITEKALNETSVKLNPTGSVLIAMYGATIGKIGILTFPATTNQACCACEVFNGIDKEFLFLFLLSHREEFVKMGGGGAQPNISKEKIINTYIPLPPFAEQKRIVTTVNVLFTKLDDIMESL